MASRARTDLAVFYGRNILQPQHRDQHHMAKHTVEATFSQPFSTMQLDIRKLLHQDQ
jgi:hypothetical protein